MAVKLHKQMATPSSLGGHCPSPSLGLLLNAMGSSLILESLSISGMAPGLSRASSDARDSALRAAEDPGKGFFLPVILTIVVVIVSSRGSSKKCKNMYLDL